MEKKIIITQQVRGLSESFYSLKSQEFKEREKKKSGTKENKRKPKSCAGRKNKRIKDKNKEKKFRIV